jgi:hypothetical protein
MMHEGDEFHESIPGDKTPEVVVMTAAAAGAGANDQREPRKFFPRVKMLLSYDYEPVRISYLLGLGSSLSPSWQSFFRDGWLLLSQSILSSS